MGAADRVQGVDLPRSFGSIEAARLPTRVLGLALASLLLGTAPVDPALQTVRAALADARRVVDGESTRDEKLGSLRGVARKLFDTKAMGRRAMGDLLNAQSPQQQEEYFELFDHVIIRAYLQKLLFFRKPRFGYRKPRLEGDIVVVRTKIITSNDEYYVDYEMVEREGRWLATDVIIEGVSLSENYHEQFSSLLRERSFEELLDLMRRKTRRLREEPV